MASLSYLILQKQDEVISRAQTLKPDYYLDSNLCWVIYWLCDLQ